VGTPVRAAGAGRVQFVGVKGGYGNVVVIAHAGGVTTLYGHLSRFAVGLSPNDRVQQGELLGRVGMSGLATGPHLHYEYRLNGIHRDPSKVTMPKAEPIPAQLRADFLAKTSVFLAELNTPDSAPSSLHANAASR
jgi:murein DD-endopeptidase MepM/ murein hydrolase activator NlpD